MFQIYPPNLQFSVKRGLDLMREMYVCFEVPPLCRETSAFAVREIDVPRHNGGTSGALLKPLRDDSAPT